jgi:hypothetical protein
LRIRNLHKLAAACSEWVQPRAISLDPARITKGGCRPDEIVAFGRGVCEFWKNPAKWLLLAHIHVSAKQTGCAALKQAGGNIAERLEREKGKYHRAGEMHKLQAFRAQFTKRCKISLRRSAG